MKLVLAMVGAFVLFLSFLGTVGIGNFVLMYSPDKISCVKSAE